MHDALMWLRDGGPWTFLMLLVLLPALGLAVAHLAVARRWSLIAAVAPVLVIVALGVVGREIGLSRLDAALSSGDIDPSMMSLLAAKGAAEAAVPLRFAIICAVLCGLPLAVGEVRRLTRRA